MVATLSSSLHTVNERLRDARRKLGVTSSREAARQLLVHERETPELLGDKPLGDALTAGDEAGVMASATRRWARPGPALTAIGVLAMSLIIAALLISGSIAVQGSGDARDAGETPSAAPVNLDPLQTIARTWLGHIDKQEWQQSHASSAAVFQQAISASAWAQAAAQARKPLGRVLKRELLEYGSVSAPRAYRLAVFKTDFAHRSGAIETVTLEREGSVYKVSGYWIK